MIRTAKKNPVAKALRGRQFHQRILVSKKSYNRAKEKSQIYVKDTRRD